MSAAPFEAIATDPARLAEFTACIGDVTAPSRLWIAGEVLRLLRVSGRARVLDVGAGLGTLHETLREVSSSAPAAGLGYVGFDDSPAMRAAATAVVLPMTELEDAAANIDAAGATPNVVVLRHVLEHQANPWPLLERAMALPRVELGLVVWSQLPQRVAPWSLKTDEHLGAPRWSHDYQDLRRQLAGAGWGIARSYRRGDGLDGNPFEHQEPGAGFVVREEGWVLKRLGSGG